MIKVLIIDDEPEITENFKEFLALRITQAEFHGALTVKEASEKISQLSPDLLLVDLNLNDQLTGLDVYKIALSKNPAVKAIVITGNVEEKVREDCFAAGIQKVLYKPISLAALKEDVIGMLSLITEAKSNHSSS